MIAILGIREIGIPRLGVQKFDKIFRKYPIIDSRKPKGAGKGRNEGKAYL